MKPPRLPVWSLMLLVLVVALYAGGLRCLVRPPSPWAQALAAAGLSVLTAAISAAVKVMIRPGLRRRWASWRWGR